MIGRLAAVALLLVAVLAGGVMYYLQVYGFYDRLPAPASLTIATPEGPVEIAVRGFEGIDSDSSPIRYRACFTTDPDAPLPAYEDRAIPLNAPGWFSCFDAPRIGAALASGEARAVLLEGHVRYGIDRVAASFPDGRVYAWTQINRCGTALFDGNPLPPGCPPPPQDR